LESRVNYLNIETEKLHQLILEKDALINTLNAKIAEKEREIEALKKKNFGSESQRMVELEDLRNRLNADHVI